MIVKCPESVKVHSSLKGTLLGSAAINTTLQHTSGLHHSTLHTLQWPRQWADTCPHYPQGMMWCVMTRCLFPHYIIMTYDVRAGPAVPRQGKLLGRTQARSQRSLPVVVAPSLSLQSRLELGLSLKVVARLSLRTLGLWPGVTTII